MPQTTKTRGAGALAKPAMPVKTATSAAKPGRIANLGSWAHSPKRKGK